MSADTDHLHSGQPAAAVLRGIPTVLSCNTCEVTWRDLPQAPCWFCGKRGQIANPERLVLD